jgi:predicted transcriptional regulator
MLTFELINHSIPHLTISDTIGKAWQLFDEWPEFSHLAVTGHGKFTGLIGKKEIEEFNELTTLDSLPAFAITQAVAHNEHFLSAVNFCNRFHTAVIPVINEENEFIGCITSSDLLMHLGNFTGAASIGGIIVLEIERSHFSISEISRIAESNDAVILHLNTTTHTETGLLTITVHLDKKDVSDIVATFERYQYTITGYFGSEKFEKEIQSNFLHLMNYLDI